ncbi:MAG: hypothetical protein RR291_04450, partial [Clostridia bacterium]
PIFLYNTKLATSVLNASAILDKSNIDISIVLRINKLFSLSSDIPALLASVTTLRPRVVINNFNFSASHTNCFITPLNLPLFGHY